MRATKGIPALRHGTVTGYRYYGCRCVECKRAQATSLREYRESKRSPNAR